LFSGPASAIGITADARIKHRKKKEEKWRTLFKGMFTDPYNVIFNYYTLFPWVA
jgi:hypothetical protein